jgi:hypothetical protein
MSPCLAGYHTLGSPHARVTTRSRVSRTRPGRGAVPRSPRWPRTAATRRLACRAAATPLRRRGGLRTVPDGRVQLGLPRVPQPAAGELLEQLRDIPQRQLVIGHWSPTRRRRLPGNAAQPATPTRPAHSRREAPRRQVHLAGRTPAARRVSARSSAASPSTGCRWRRRRARAFRQVPEVGVGDLHRRRVRGEQPHPGMLTERAAHIRRPAHRVDHHTKHLPPAAELDYPIHRRRRALEVGDELHLHPPVVQPACRADARMPAIGGDLHRQHPTPTRSMRSLLRRRRHRFPRRAPSARLHRACAMPR